LAGQGRGGPKQAKLARFVTPNSDTPTPFECMYITNARDNNYIPSFAVDIVIMDCL